MVLILILAHIRLRSAMRRPVKIVTKFMFEALLSPMVVTIAYVMRSIRSIILLVLHH